jgi:hypothetical protein
MKLATTIVGACGEHYVAAYLSGHGLIVAIPRGGVPGSDVFVSKEQGGNALRVQVKTGTQATRRDKEVGNIYLWATSYAVIERNDRNVWYAYLWLNGWPAGEKSPEVFFVPAKVVVNCMKECRADGDTWPYFWMRVDEAQRYKGPSGLKGLVAALG